MTRATLLRLLAHPTALNGADVRALEELAEAFPYCQTAHLLLAKAAHDHGSMLVGQRLRRAATYAADRTLLRQLIEAAPVEETLEPAAAEAAMSESVAAAGIFAEISRPTPLPFGAGPAAPLVLEDKPAQEIGPAPAAAPASTAALTELAAPVDLPASPLLPTPPAEETPAASTGPAPGPEAPAATEQAALAPATVSEPAGTELSNAATATTPPLTTEPLDEEAPVPAEPAAPTEQYHPAAPATTAATVAPATGDTAELTAVLATEATLADDAADQLAQPTPLAVEDKEPASTDALFQPVADADASASEELPVQAPPIRPPADAEVASQEFGLALQEPAEVMAYQLPELELAITIPLAPAAATPRLPAFTGVPDVAYAPGEGSRYGFCLVPVADTDGPLIPAAGLPPTGEFFLPDALLLAHLAEPPALPTSTTTDLINSFLQRAPRAQRQRPPFAPVSPQADLSVRSTRTTPDLASESLAKILVKQGKVEQAIAVYERLMVKMPEKSAIFAAEIEALRPPA